MLGKSSPSYKGTLGSMTVPEQEDIFLTKVPRNRGVIWEPERKGKISARKQEVLMWNAIPGENIHMCIHVRDVSVLATKQALF